MKHFILLLFIAAVLIIYFLPRPFGFVITDEFVYTFSAMNLVDKHTLLYSNELMQKYEDPAFVPSWYVPISDTVSVPKYYPGFSFILAIFYGLGGKSAMIYANAVLGLIGLFIIYKLGELLFNKETGLIAAILLGFNPIYVIMVYSYFSHITATIFILFSMFLWFKWGKKNNKLSFLSGISLGYSILAHITSAILIVPIFISSLIEKNSKIKSFLLGLFVILAFIAMYNLMILDSPIKTAYNVINEDVQFKIDYVLPNAVFYLRNSNIFMNAILILGLLGFIGVEKHKKIFFAIFTIIFISFFLFYYFASGVGPLLGMRFILPVIVIFSLLSANFIKLIGKNHHLIILSIVFLIIVFDAVIGLPLFKNYNDAVQAEKIKWECVAGITNKNDVILADTSDGGEALVMANRLAYDYYRTTPYELITNIDDMLQFRDVYISVTGNREFLTRHPLVYKFPNNDKVISAAYSLEPTTCDTIYQVLPKMANFPSQNITAASFDENNDR